MYAVALTGGIASGKSTAANYFGQLGAHIIDADIIARQITEPDQPAFKQIIDHFGPEYVTTEGIMNRQKLLETIFIHAHHRKWLENLLHPLILATMKSRVAEQRNTYCILVIPLLAEVGLEKNNNTYQRVLVIDCDPNLQKQRLLTRPQMTTILAEKILATQATRAERLAIADDIIENNGSITNLEQQIKAMHQQYLTCARAQGIV